MNPPYLHSRAWNPPPHLRDCLAGYLAACTEGGGGRPTGSARTGKVRDAREGEVEGEVGSEQGCGGSWEEGEERGKRKEESYT